MNTPRRKPRKSVTIHRPQSRLTALVNRPGGITRDAAIAAGTRELELLRVPYMGVINDMIGNLETAAAGHEHDVMQRLVCLQFLADRLMTLAGSFGLTHLVEAARGLYEVSRTLAARGIMDENAITVHIRAIRFLGPLGEAVSEETAAMVLAELLRVVEHFQAGDAAGPPPDSSERLH